jgi:hypothetical protein
VRGIALHIPETLEGTDSDVNSRKAVELNNGFAEGDAECWHGETSSCFWRYGRIAALSENEL